MKIAVSSIRIDGGAQPRARVSVETVSEYAAEMKGGAKFPAIVVFFDGAEYWLADGFHRRDAPDVVLVVVIPDPVGDGRLAGTAHPYVAGPRAPEVG